VDAPLRHHLCPPGQEDNILIGVKFTALKLGAATKPWLVAFYAGSLGLLTLAGGLVALSWPFFVLLASVAAHFAWQILNLDLNDPKDCLAKFKSNRTVGVLVFAAILLGRVCA
jgi:4-hydroxybenzoate polyprenyltransferase